MEEGTQGRIITVVLCLIIIIYIIFVATPFIFRDYGNVEGTFVEYELHPMGDFCGDYAWTMIRLTDFEFEGEEAYNREGRFYFDEYDTSVANLKEGEVYTLYYHKSSRPSDTTSGNAITTYILDSVEKQ